MISIESSTIDQIGNRDYGLLKTASERFGFLTDTYENFYTTIFFNDDNRKVCLYFYFGKLKRMTIDKIDIVEE